MIFSQRKRVPLAAEGELELTPRPIGNDPVFTRINTGVIDDGC